MLYRKNLPLWERVLRATLGVALIVYVALFASSLLPVGIAVCSGLVLAITGMFGYCPMCAIAGRKFIDSSEQS